MAAYFILELKIKDGEAMGHYAHSVPQTINAVGGRFIALSEPEVLEGDWKPERITMVEFPNLEVMKNWYVSPAYAEAEKFRQQGSDSNTIFVDGV